MSGEDDCSFLATTCKGFRNIFVLNLSPRYLVANMKQELASTLARPSIAQSIGIEAKLRIDTDRVREIGWEIEIGVKDLQFTTKINIEPCLMR